MRELWLGGATVAACVAASALGLGATGLMLGTTGPAAAQQSPPVTAQPAIVDPDQPLQALPPPKPAKPARHARGQAAAPALQADPDLDTDDQLAPSQIRQPMPAAVAEPGGSKRSNGNPVMHAATDAPAAPAAPAAPPAPAVRPRPSTTRAASPESRVVACTGAFSKDSSHLRLAMTYDSKNIAFADVDATGGTKVPASVLFPNDPKHRLEVWWSNPAARNQTYLIVINGQSTWAGPGGMKLGLTLAELEKLNRKPFKVKGFDKDGVATVSDWNDGALGSLPGGCKSGLSLRADPKAAADAVSALTADQEFSSSDPAIRAVKPTVSEILIGY